MSRRAASSSGTSTLPREADALAHFAGEALRDQEGGLVEHHVEQRRPIGRACSPTG